MPGDELYGGSRTSSALRKPGERARARGTSRRPGGDQELVLPIGTSPVESQGRGLAPVLAAIAIFTRSSRTAKLADLCRLQDRQ